MQHLTKKLREGSRHRLIWLAALASLLAPVAVRATENGHADPIAPVILGVAWILSMAILGRFAARSLNQPAVVGELLMGIAIGHMGYLGGGELITVLREVPQVFLLMNGATADMLFDGDTAAAVTQVLNGPRGGVMLQVAHSVDVFSRYGVIFLLFLVGLDSSVPELRSVGVESARVALIGVIAPFVLGVFILFFLMPDVNPDVRLFVAATLVATSVGITARVLQELGQEHSAEGRIILGAAIIDDILGLLMLAVISGILVSGEFNFSQVTRLLLLSVAFFGGAVFLGPRLLKILIRFLVALDPVEAKLFTAFLFATILAWFANLVGLATIVGAFMAGLLLNDAYFPASDEKHHFASIKDLIQPLEAILLPIFFVLMGIQVKLETLNDPVVLIVALHLVLAAIVGKLISGLGAPRGVRRLAVGFGMLPRGEVGLVFASIGKTLGVVSDTLFSSIVVMVIVTTLLAPGLLKWSLRDAGADRIGSA
ncbi:MAG: cation:proton antiporter [Gammaproteobacteria bacterium]|nr:cation:proton antiporter [Gammaproteobacteria bacterium]